MQNFSLENHHLMRAPARHFLMDDIYWGVKSVSSPTPLNGQHDHWTFVEEGGMGDFEVIIFSQTSGVRISFPSYDGVRYFFQHYASWVISFSVQDIVFPRNFFACFFSLEISLQDIFSEITYKPLKTQIVGP